MQDAALVELMDTLTVIAHALVTNRENVKISAKRSGDVVVVQVSADESQFGRLIGESGLTARAFRRIAGAVAGKYKVHCDLNLSMLADERQV